MVSALSFLETFDKDGDSLVDHIVKHGLGILIVGPKKSIHGMELYSFAQRN